MLYLRPFVRRNRELESYNPFRTLQNLERELWNNDFFGRGALSAFKTDIKDNGDSYLLEADLPGFKKEDIHIEFDDKNLVIGAERHSEKEDKDKEGNFICSERSFGSYSRSFDISGIDTGGMKASYEDGVLRLTLPKSKPVEVETAKRLEIE